MLDRGLPGEKPTEDGLVSDVSAETGMRATYQQSGRYGPFHELHQYNLIPSGLEPTLAGWEKSVGARTASSYSPVYAAFYATDGRTPRYLHIWPYATLEQRLDVRGRAVADGVWPPENSGPQLLEMRSTVCLPAAFSPLS